MSLNKKALTDMISRLNHEELRDVIGMCQTRLAAKYREEAEKQGIYLNVDEKSLVEKGQKTQAIKAVRRRLNLRLYMAKALVDDYFMTRLFG